MVTKVALSVTAVPFAGQLIPACAPAFHVQVLCLSPPAIQTYRNMCLSAILRLRWSGSGAELSLYGQAVGQKEGLNGRRIVR